MRTKKITQRQKLLELLRKAGASGINSHDATYIYGIKQAPTRILELKEEGYEIHTTPPLKNRSVIWTLTFVPEQKKKIIDWRFEGNTAIPIYG